MSLATPMDVSAGSTAAAVTDAASSSSGDIIMACSSNNNTDKPLMYADILNMDLLGDTQEDGFDSPVGSPGGTLQPVHLNALDGISLDFPLNSIEYNQQQQQQQQESGGGIEYDGSIGLVVNPIGGGRCGGGGRRRPSEPGRLRRSGNGGGAPRLRLSVEQRDEAKSKTSSCMYETLGSPSRHQHQPTSLQLNVVGFSLDSNTVSRQSSSNNAKSSSSADKDSSSSSSASLSSTSSSCASSFTDERAPGEEINKMIQGLNPVFPEDQKTLQVSEFYS